MELVELGDQPILDDDQIAFLQQNPLPKDRLLPLPGVFSSPLSTTTSTEDSTSIATTPANPHSLSTSPVTSDGPHNSAATIGNEISPSKSDDREVNV